MTDGRAVRRPVPEVLSALVPRHGHFDACEDAVREASLAAAAQWPVPGWPDNPKAWLVTVASRRLTDQLRGNAARRRREEAEAARTPPPLDGADFGDAGSPPARDDTLTLLFLCCHPAPSPASQIALTLRAVGGLSTTEIAAVDDHHGLGPADGLARSLRSRTEPGRGGRRRSRGAPRAPGSRPGHDSWWPRRLEPADRSSGRTSPAGKRRRQPLEILDRDR